MIICFSAIKVVILLHRTTPKIERYMASLKTTKTSGEVPTDYTLCTLSDCPKSAICLRHAAVAMMPAEVITWRIVSLTHLAQAEGECIYYRSTEKVRYARGFVRMIRSLPVNVSEIVAKKLIARFGRNAYYDMRKGKRAIAPNEQEVIRTVVAECGGPQEIAFDSYEEDYQW